MQGVSVYIDKLAPCNSVKECNHIGLSLVILHN